MRLRWVQKLTVLRHILRTKKYLDMYLEMRATPTCPFVKNNMQSFTGNMWDKMVHIGKGRSDVTHGPTVCCLSGSSSLRWTDRRMLALENGNVWATRRRVLCGF